MDTRPADRRTYALVAALFAVIVLGGFGRTYYFKFAFDTPPLPSPLVHIHGLLMTAWVALFVTQVSLIRTKRVAVHRRLGWLGAGLAVAIIGTGFFTAVAAAKNGSASTPPGIPRLTFLAVPIFDLVLFALLFGAAIYFRKQPAHHKRLMALTAVNFLPPALGRLPLGVPPSAAPAVFFGLPTALIIAFAIYDARQHHQWNRAFIVGALVLIASYPLRMVVAFTDAWTSFATWLTTWAA